MRATLPAALLASAAVALAARPAHAILCSSLPNPVYVAGSGKVVVADLGKALSSSGITLVYKLEGSCLALDSILNGTKITSTAAAPASYWSATDEMSCDLDPDGDTVDVGISDVFPTTCQSLPNGLPNSVGDFQGPVEAYTFVVPKGSSQKVISARAGYFVAGFGGDSGVSPWTEESAIFHRELSSGTQQLFSVGLGVPADRWRGVTVTSSGDMVTKVAGYPLPDLAIGILTEEVAGANRATIDVLAYQAKDQTCGYWPDSTPAAFDKQNVRDGHYELWGPLHLLTRLDNSGYPVNATARDFIGYLTGTKLPPSGFDLITLLAQSNIVPACAMQVRRETELGPLASFAPDRSCGCYFELTASGKTDCHECSTDVECPEATPRCNYGYCEAQ